MPSCFNAQTKPEWNLLQTKIRIKIRPLEAMGYRRCRRQFN